MKIPLAVELLPQGAMLGCCRLLITRERGRSSCFGPNCGSSIGPTATAHQQEKEQDQRTSHRGNKTTFSHRGTLGISHQVHPQTLRISTSELKDIYLLKPTKPSGKIQANNTFFGCVWDHRSKDRESAAKAQPMISSNVASIAREEDVRSSLQSPGTKRVAEPTKASPPTEMGKVAKKNGDISPGSMQSPENKV